MSRHPAADRPRAATLENSGTGPGPRRPAAGDCMLERPGSVASKSPVPKSTAPGGLPSGGFSGDGLEPVDAAAFAAPKRLEAGPAPMLAWIEIGLLRIDRGYQREIRRAGERNVRAIIDGFCWSKFAPVLIAPIAGGLYAIIDGQHRATAAAACGFESVPCQIVQVDRAEQAEAFAAVNGQVTPMSLMAIHRAAVVAGDPEAVRIARVAEAAGVRIMPYPRQVGDLKPNETMAIGAIRTIVRLHGDDLSALVLRAIWASGEGCNGGALMAPVILGVADVLAEANGWAAHSRLVAVLDEFDFVVASAERRRGETGRAAVARQLRTFLGRALG